MSLHENLSQKVFKALTRLGYSKENISKKAAIYDNASEASTIYHRAQWGDDLQVFITGSRREGIAVFWNSDIDEMIVPTNVLCVETNARRELTTGTTESATETGVFGGHERSHEHGSGKCTRQKTDAQKTELDSQQMHTSSNPVNAFNEQRRSVKNLKVAADFDELAEKEGNHRVILQMQHTEAPPGYVFLRMEDDAGPINHPLLKEKFVHKNGFKYLENEQMVREFEHMSDVAIGKEISQQCTDSAIGWMRHHTRYQEDWKKGPAQPFELPMPLENKMLHYDHVLALECRCCALQEWCNLERQRGWPLNDVVGRIRQLPVHVVPAGVRGSQDEHLQWRICFTLAELELVRTFNETQMKVYVLLKTFVKELLEYKLKTHGKVKRHKSLSYLVKNVMFWTAEEIPEHHCTELTFKSIFMYALGKLHQGLYENSIPNYMIPSRNLCSEKLLDEERIFIMTELTKLLQGGFGVVKTVPSLREELENEDESELETKALTRRTSEYLLLCTFTLPPEKLAKLMEMFNAATSPEACFAIFRAEVLTFLRHHDTSGFMEQFKQLSDEDLFRTIWDIYSQGY